MNLKVDNVSIIDRLYQDVNVDSEYNLIEKVVSFLDDNDIALSYSEIVNMLRNDIIDATWGFVEAEYFEFDREPDRVDTLDMLEEQTSVIWFDEEEVIFLKF